MLLDKNNFIETMNKEIGFLSEFAVIIQYIH